MYRIILLCLLILLFFLGIYKTIASADIVPEAVKEVVKDLVFERIASCESGGNLHAKNPHSSASGEFQWINSSWYHYGKEFWGEEFYTKNIWSTDNRELAWYVYKKYGTSDWDASKWCWQKYDIIR